MEGQTDGAEETIEETPEEEIGSFLLDDDMAEAEPVSEPAEPEAETPEAELETEAEAPVEEPAESEETPEAEAPAEEPAPEPEVTAGTPDKTGVEKKVEEMGYALQNINQRLTDLMTMKDNQTPAETVKQVEEIKDELADLEDDDAITKSDAVKLADSRVDQAIAKISAEYDAKLQSIQSAAEAQAADQATQNWLSQYESKGERYKGKGQEVLDAAHAQMSERYSAEVQNSMDDQVYGDLLNGIIQGVEATIIPAEVSEATPKAEPKPTPKPSSKGTQVKKPGAQSKSVADTKEKVNLDPAEFSLMDDD